MVFQNHGVFLVFFFQNHGVLEKKKHDNMTRVDKLRIATRFWLNINLRKTMNSWKSFHAEARHCKKLLDSAIQHWGLARLEYGFQRWLSNTRVKFEKKTYFKPDSRTLVTLLIRTALFEEPKQTKVLLSETPLGDNESSQLEHSVTKLPVAKMAVENKIDDKTF